MNRTGIIRSTVHSHGLRSPIADTQSPRLDRAGPWRAGSLGDSWGILFSHPKDFTPVCTTELGTMARIKPDFDARIVKIIGLSVDPFKSHQRWSQDIAETQGTAPNYPMIGDIDLTVSKRKPERLDSTGTRHSPSSFP